MIKRVPAPIQTYLRWAVDYMQLHGFPVIWRIDTVHVNCLPVRDRDISRLVVKIKSRSISKN